MSSILLELTCRTWTLTWWIRRWRLTRPPSLLLLKITLLRRPMLMMLPPPWLVMTLLLTPKSDTCEEISFTFWWPVMFWAFCKSNFRTIFLIYFENNVCYPMFYGPVVELTIVFGYEIICFCSCLANACDVFPSFLGLSLSFFFFFFYALFEGFCQVFGFVSNVHPSRRNLVT